MTLAIQPAFEKKIMPKLAFLGVGWIGINRLEAIRKSGLAQIAAIADPYKPALVKVSEIIPGSALYDHPEEILLLPDLDGVVIATPNAFHAEQAVAALNSGFSVFCQKPLGRNASEASEVVEAARKNNKLLEVDLSYRYTKAFQSVHQLIKSGEVGKIYFINLTFHNAYGPGKEWFYDTNLSGGGCVIDLGIHLIDLALYAMDFPEVIKIDGKLYSKGNRISSSEQIAEDYATALIELENDVTLNLNCSWELNAGCESVIEISFYGTKGTASFKNINGSFYNFSAELFHRTTKKIIAEPPDDWMGKAGVEWVRKLSYGNNFNTNAEEFIKSAEVIDMIYRKGKK